MKKYIITLLIFILLLAVPLAARAAEAYGPENSAAEGVKAVGEGTAPETEEPLPAGEDAGENWFESAKAWCSQYAPSVAVGLAALYAILPKIGGVAMVLKGLDKVTGLFALLKTYIADEKNENSIYNVLKRQGDTVTRFMNDMYPKIEALESKLSALDAANMESGKLRAALLAVEESVELMAKEFSDLISISTTVSQKRKATMEEDFMRAKEHLHTTVKEALGNDGQGEAQGT